MSNILKTKFHFSILSNKADLKLKSSLSATFRQAREKTLHTGMVFEKQIIIIWKKYFCFFYCYLDFYLDKITKRTSKRSLIQSLQKDILMKISGTSPKTLGTD
ncbi:MAG: hypothetical protein C0433_17570 [Cyclobacterium sp.]|nr:hypothetical protein [Cyclobacterium sp.]